MVEMIQLASREEWLKNRQRIGGSDASAIVGMNPYRSNVDLWKIKTGPVGGGGYLLEATGAIWISGGATAAGNCLRWISRNIKFSI